MPNGNKNKGGVNPTKPPLLKRVRQSIAFTASDYDKKHSVDEEGNLKSKYRVGEGKNDGFVLQGASYRGRDMNFNYEPDIYKGGAYDEYAKTGELSGWYGQEMEKYGKRRALELEDGTIIEGFDEINKYLSEQKGGYSDVAFMIEGDRKFKHRASTKHGTTNYFKDSQTAQGYKEALHEIRMGENKDLKQYMYDDRIEEKDKAQLYGSDHGLALWFRQLDMDSLRVNDIIDQFNTGAEAIRTGQITPRDKPEEKDKGRSGTSTIKGGVSVNTKKI